MTPEETRVFGTALGTIGRMLAGLDDEQRAWLRDVPVSRALGAFDAHAGVSDFDFLSPEIEALDGEVRVRGGADWTRPFWQLVALHLVARSLQAPRPYVLPPQLLEFLLDDLERIVAAAGAGPEDPLADSDFVLDLALSRGAAIPFGAFFGVPYWVEEPTDGVDPGLWLQFHLRHAGQEGAADLESDFMRGQVEHQALIAAFEIANPDCKGWFGVGWMLDPNLAQVAPHLTWYREIMLSVGAHIVPAGTDDQTIALATGTSATRRALFEGGHYQPRDYRVIMPREATLAWSDALAEEAAKSP
jgi:hypothetical protein